jgi:hypothetical protein
MRFIGFSSSPMQTMPTKKPPFIAVLNWGETYINSFYKATKTIFFICISSFKIVSFSLRLPVRLIIYLLEWLKWCIAWFGKLGTLEKCIFLILPCRECPLFCAYCTNQLLTYTFVTYCFESRYIVLCLPFCKNKLFINGLQPEFI